MCLFRSWTSYTRRKSAHEKCDGKRFFTGVSISGDARDLVSGPVAMKLFLEPSGDNDYAELYTNVALAARRLEVHEKDAGYRMPIVRALCGD